MASRAELEAYLDSPDEPLPIDSRRAALAAYLDSDDLEAPPGGLESAYRGAVQGATYRFGDEIAAGIGAGAYGLAKGVRALLPGDVPEDAPGVVDVYRSIRDDLQRENAEAQAANPIRYAGGEIVGGLAGSGVNPVSALRVAGTTARSLLSREGASAALQAGRALLTREGATRAALEGAKAAGSGAAVGGALALGGSEADLTRGEIEEALADTLEGAETGAKLAVGARALLGVGSQAQAARTQRAARDARTARTVEEFDAATAALPEERAAVQARNAEEIAAAKAESKLALDAAKAEQKAANLEAKAENVSRRGAVKQARADASSEAQAATAAKQAKAQTALVEETRKNALVRTGLEGKQRTLGGARRAKDRAQALVEEPLPGDPSRRLVDEADRLSPDDRLVFATKLRREAGGTLGAVRDELAKVDTLVPVGPLRAELRGAFGELPSAVQAKALEQLDSLVGSVAKDGALTPAALRKLIEDAEGFTSFGTPALEAALGTARERVFQTARAALVRAERGLIESALPNRAPEYAEALRRYGVYSDFELGSRVMLERVNKGRPAVRTPKAAKVEPVAPRDVPDAEPVFPRQIERPTPRQPLLQAEPQAPEFPGGEAALAQGRKLLEPSLSARAGAAAIKYGTSAGGAAVGGGLGAATGIPGAGPAGAFAGGQIGAAQGEALAQTWLRWVTPTGAKLSARVEKLERLRPMLEEALRKGPAAIAALHARLMERSPDYRKAVEAGE